MLYRGRQIRRVDRQAYRQINRSNNYLDDCDRYFSSTKEGNAEEIHTTHAAVQVNLIPFQHCSQLKHCYLLFRCCMTEKRPEGFLWEFAATSPRKQGVNDQGWGVRDWRCDGVIKSDASQRGSRGLRVPVPICLLGLYLI
jgi:hypothetical protein